MTEVRSRSDVASAAGLLFAATLIILIDVRVPDLDIVADAIGGVLVVVAALRIHGAISGADLLRTAFVVLAVIALPVTILETLTPATGALGLLGLSQLIGTIVLARLLSEAFGGTAPGLAGDWRMAFQLAIWLALVPFVVGVMLGRVADGVNIESPIVLVLLVILAIPLVAVLRAVWGTAQGPRTDPAIAPAEVLPPGT